MEVSDVGENVTDAGDSALPESSAPNIVTVGEHTVTLHPKVTMPLGIAAFSVVKQGGSQAVIEAGLVEVYLQFGIADWTFPEPITQESVARLLPFADGGLEVAEAADALYSGEVFRPLARRISALSATSSTARSTSPIPATGSRRPKPSRPSSRNGTAGKPSGVRAL